MKSSDRFSTAQSNWRVLSRTQLKSFSRVPALMTSRYSSSPKTVHDDVVHKCALRIEQRRILRLPDGQLRGVVHRDMLNSGERLRAGEPDVAHVADVEDADAGAHRHVLVDDSAANDAGYSTGMSQPLNSTIFAPIWRWTAFSAVLRMAGASTEDKIDLKASSGWLPGMVWTDYRITQFFGGSNGGWKLRRTEKKIISDLCHSEPKRESCFSPAL